MILGLRIVACTAPTGLPPRCHLSPPLLHPPGPHLHTRHGLAWPSHTQYPLSLYPSTPTLSTPTLLYHPLLYPYPPLPPPPLPPPPLPLPTRGTSQKTFPPLPNEPRSKPSFEYDCGTTVQVLAVVSGS